MSNVVEIRTAESFLVQTLINMKCKPTRAKDENPSIQMVIKMS